MDKNYIKVTSENYEMFGVHGGPDEAKLLNICLMDLGWGNDTGIYAPFTVGIYHNRNCDDGVMSPTGFVICLEKDGEIAEELCDSLTIKDLDKIVCVLHFAFRAVNNI